jgi:DNA-binding transcriptional LysR family regulator
MHDLIENQKFEEMETFATVAETGSFAGAAKRLGRDASVLSRRITALERRLSVRLLVRTTRSVGLTEAGGEYLARVESILAEIADADAEISRRATTPSGTLRIALPAAFGRIWIAPLIPGFLSAYPDIKVEGHFSDAFVDIVADRIDVAIRIGALLNSGLVARRIASFSRVLSASPNYLARRGVPNVPDDLHRHACIGFAGHGFARIWRLQREAETAEINVAGSFVADDGEALVTAALGGSGILLAADWLVGREVEAGRLVEVLPGWRASDVDAINAVLPPGRLAPAKTRSFVEWVEKGLSPVPPWRMKPHG